jgi:SAM-dependent methyltransferase
MRFYGFSPRAVLVRKYLEVRPEDVVLEIGPGSGNTARAVIGRTAGYWGVDVSVEAVQGLREAFGDRKDVVFAVADACGDGFLGRTFDRIFSVDTLEHVDEAQAFFRFAARHLMPGGEMLICFPNGMSEKKGRACSQQAGGAAERHGVTWFETRAELEGVVRDAGFEIDEILEIRDSAWQSVVRALLWDAPRTLALGALRILRAARGKRGERITGPEKNGRAGRGSPSKRETYEGTESFHVNKRGGMARDAAALYARFAESAARIFPPYKACPADDAIFERRVLLRLRKSGLKRAGAS